MKSTETAALSQRTDFNAGIFCRGETIKTENHDFHHHHVEMRLIKKGLVTYRSEEAEIKVGAGRLVALWAAMPRQITVSPGAEAYTVGIPLSWFLQFRLADHFTQGILGGKIFVEPEASSAGDVEMFNQWIGDLQSPQKLTERALMLEVEARLLRFGNAVAAQTDVRPTRLNCDSHSARRIQEMIFFIASNYTESITSGAVGKSAGLHPNYATSLFRKVVGTTLTSYITRFRVSHARHLLATTNCKVVDVAMRSGFSSLSRFNDAFKRSCGRSPRDFRLPPALAAA